MAMGLPQGLRLTVLWIYLTVHTRTQVNDFVPFNDLQQYRILANCPKTLLDRVASEQFTAVQCDATQKTAECVCNTNDYPRVDTMVANKISSVIDAGCEVSDDASKAYSVFYSWCTTNAAEAIAASYGIDVPTGSSSGVYILSLESDPSLCNKRPR